MIQITDSITFNESLSFDDQSEEFKQYAKQIFALIDYTDMSNMIGNECIWTKEQDGLSFIAKRIYINPKYYTVMEHLFNVEIIG